jgi:hypothetical protein
MPRTAELSRLPTRRTHVQVDAFEGDRDDVDDSRFWLLRKKQLIPAGVIFNESKTRNRHAVRSKRSDRDR